MSDNNQGKTIEKQECSGSTEATLLCLFCAGDNVSMNSNGEGLYNTSCDDCGACGPVGRTAEQAKRLYLYRPQA